MKRNVELLPLVNFFAETLRDALADSGETQVTIAAATGIPPSHLTQMKQGKRRCTPEYDIRLSRYFSMTPGLWLRLQLDYELMRAEREKGEQIRREVQPHAA